MVPLSDQVARYTAVLLACPRNPDPLSLFACKPSGPNIDKASRRDHVFDCLVVKSNLRDSLPACRAGCLWHMSCSRGVHSSCACFAAWEHGTGVLSVVCRTLPPATGAVLLLAGQVAPEEARQTWLTSTFGSIRHQGRPQCQSCCSPSEA